MAVLSVMGRLIGKWKHCPILSSRISYHLYFWGLSYSVYLILARMIFEEKSFGFLMMYSLWQVALCSVAVYLNFYAFNKLLIQGKYYLYGVSLIGIIFVSGILIRSFFVTAFSDKFGLYNYFFEITCFVSVTTIIKFIKSSFVQRLELQEMKTKQLQTELSLLKAQINPHFLFNTLNNLFGLARRQDKGTAEGIAQLSHLMRYMIYDSNVDKIELEKEVRQIHRLIELQKFRFSEEDEITIDFRIKGNVKEIQIPPMLLIPFVENAFKHGISLQKPSFLKIDLAINGQDLQFSVKNTIHRSKQHVDESDSGVGLKNVKRRLELLYPGAHELKIREEKDIFGIELTLKS